MGGRERALVQGNSESLRLAHGYSRFIYMMSLGNAACCTGMIFIAKSNIRFGVKWEV
jgi:hypothetical protein